MTATRFIREWQRRSRESADPSDRFFSAWIALVVLARRDLDERDLSQPDVDRKAVLALFENNAATINDVLNDLEDSTRWLAARRGAGTAEALLDVNLLTRRHKALRSDFDVLALVWGGSARRKPTWVATATAELINHVRNNMFHGLKAPDDAGDRELLERINPILLAVLLRLEPHTGRITMQ